ncbi:hypothetical protein [Paenibacillus silvisoli]|uniref:hypothetical protein n=1 Tax=Paenibacillus silvisoli TaxID=3110539 RepID=UPI002805E03D|nr:hypothetical protein [Paenibacillus silvisoli]
MFIDKTVPFLIACLMVLLGGVQLAGFFVAFAKARKTKRFSIWLILVVFFETFSWRYILAIVFVAMGTLIIVGTAMERMRG